MRFACPPMQLTLVLISLSMLHSDAEFLPMYLYPRAVIDAPPTVADGHLTQDQEAQNRAVACILIAKVGRMLQL